MATNYWDYGFDTTDWTGSTAGGYTGSTTGDYTVLADTTITSTASTTGDWHWIPVGTTATEYIPRRIVVKAPSWWDVIARANFTKMINEETQTGWKLLMWINGDIDIVDPTVEVRTLRDFIPLLKLRASEEDKDLIDLFMDKYGNE